MTYPAYWPRDNLKSSPELWHDNTELHELSGMAVESLTDGKAWPRVVLAWQPLGVITGIASVPATQATSAGIDGSACGLVAKAVKL